MPEASAAASGVSLLEGARFLMSEVPLYGSPGERGRQRRQPAGRKLLLSPMSGRGAARAEDAQGTPTQSRVSPSILAYEDAPVLVQFVCGERVVFVMGLFFFFITLKPRVES